MGETHRDDRVVASEALDNACSVGVRSSAIRELGNFETESAISALVRLATDDDLPAVLSPGAGRSLANICFRRAQDVDELVMAEMTAAAYEAYDAEIARLQRILPDRTMRRGIVGSGR
jgi:HEAT repeat protein